MSERITAERFVRTYMKVKDLDRLSDKLGVTRNYILRRSARLRRLGVQLPRPSEKEGVERRGRGNKLNVEHLNDIVKSTG